MKFVALLFLSAVVVGTQSLPLAQLENFASEFLLNGDDVKKSFIVPMQNAETAVIGFYKQLTDHYQKKGFTINNPNDCLALTNSSQVAYNVGVNATKFLVTSVSELTTSLNSLVSCTSSGDIIMQAQCFFDRIKTVKADMLTIEQNFQPYRNEVSDVWTDLVAEMRKCVGF